MRTSDDTELVFSALANAAKTLKNPVKTEKGYAGRYSYPDFAEVASGVRDVLSNNGLSCQQEAVTVGDRVGCTTRLSHESGQWIEMGPLLLPAGQGAQDYGSALTYARRYALSAALLLVAEDDDDGAAAQESSRKGTGAHDTASPSATSPPPAGNLGQGSTANDGETPSPPSSAGGANVQGKGGESTMGKGGRTSRPGDTSEASPTIQADAAGIDTGASESLSLVEQTHKFRGNDPNGACEVCGFMWEGHLGKGRA